MKAARLEAGVLEIQELPTPEPGHEQARVRIHAAGVCHSDLHIVRGDWAGVPDTMPVGHEAIGTVTPDDYAQLDVIAVGAHPDDVEIACGGTLSVNDHLALQHR